MGDSCPLVKGFAETEGEIGTGVAASNPVPLPHTASDPDLALHPLPSAAGPAGPRPAQSLKDQEGICPGRTPASNPYRPKPARSRRGPTGACAPVIPMKERFEGPRASRQYRSQEGEN